MVRVKATAIPKLLLCAFASGLLVWFVLLWRGPATVPGCFEAAVLALAVAATVAGLSQSLPSENAVLAAVMMSFLILIVQAVGGEDWDSVR